MASVGGHRRRYGDRTVSIEPQFRMPRKRQHLHPEDERIYELEREIVRLQREARDAANDASRYTDLGYLSLAEKKVEQAEEYVRRIGELRVRISESRRGAALEGVGD